VPDRGQRTALLASLTATFEAAHQPRAAKPLWVNLSPESFRTNGAISTDNGVAAAGIGRLGPDVSSGRNFMELRGDVAGHRPGIQYDIKRTIEKATWSAVTNTWVRCTSLKAGTDDDIDNADEDLSPDSGHIYVVDTPGPYFTSPLCDDGHVERDARHYYYAATFVEWVVARSGSGGWQRVSDDFYWHSVSTLVKVNGTWQRDQQGVNDIAPGPIPIISPDGGDRL
jgi:hypothetical protein